MGGGLLKKVQKPYKILKTKQIFETEKKEKIVQSHTNISDTPFNHRSPWGCFELSQTNRQTDTRTYKHGDSMTESAK